MIMMPSGKKSDAFDHWSKPFNLWVKASGESAKPFDWKSDRFDFFAEGLDQLSRALV